MKVKDIKIEHGELVVLAEARLSLSKCSMEFCRDILECKEDIINGKWYENAYIESTFSVKDDGQFEFCREAIEFSKGKND
jgi:hypothetical protein